MKKIFLFLIVGMIALFYIQNRGHAADCYAAGCNGADPAGKSCWNDAYPASRKTNGTLVNKNMYSPGCVANYSYTYNSNATYSYLSAETVGYYAYDSATVWMYVWNNMRDGSGLVCTRGHRGNSAGQHNLSIGQSCS